MTDSHGNDEQVPEGTTPEDAAEPLAEDGSVTDATDLPAAEGPDVEVPAQESVLTEDELFALLDQGSRDLVAEYKDIAARAEAELKNFRTRVERDRQANREAVIAEVIRSLLPAIDDLDRAEKHGDLTEGSPLAIVASKIRGGFDRYGLATVGEKGEPFDPARHEAIVQLPTPGAESQTVADVIEIGYILGDRLIRAAKVAVSVPA